jgi:hypothetical protein
MAINTSESRVLKMLKARPVPAQPPNVLQRLTPPIGVGGLEPRALHLVAAGEGLHLTAVGLLVTEVDRAQGARTAEAHPPARLAPKGRFVRCLLPELLFTS